MNRALAIVALLGGIVAIAPAAEADSGRIAFHGAIVEPACAVRDMRLDCPRSREAAAQVATFDGTSAAGRLHSELFDYARARDPDRTWRLLEVTWH